MTFDEAVMDLAVKVQAQGPSIQTEEATKNAFIMPFISRVLGYDVFNPLEVVPEFTADHGTKKGEKVDYAIMRDGEVQILIECKRIGDDLNVHHSSQLFRYFTVTNARVAILTNGCMFHFFTDLDSPNIMDDRPFLVLNLLDVDETLLPELRKLSREVFDLDSIISAAEELKYVGALKREVAAEFKEPSAELVKLLMGRVSDRRATADNLREFAGLTSKATKQFLKEQVNDRLKAALSGGESPSISVEAPIANEVDGVPESSLEVSDDGVVTTEEEMSGYHIIKAIAVSEVKPQRVTHRDAKSYFAILLDDNNRKPVARLHFNGKEKKYLGLLGEDKVETKHVIQELDDIYQFADQIREAVRRYA